MPRIGTAAKIAALTVAVASFVLIVSSTRSIKAQTNAWTAAYAMLLTTERALAFAAAADGRLDYVPGEVLVKFRAGVTVAGQQRALEALRSRPLPSALRWVGDVAVFTDRRERDATILAAQLNTQPEVAMA